MRSVLFTVGRLEFVGSGKFLVAGRNCSDELRRGDRLRLRNGCGSEQIEVLVDEIKAYDRTITEVGSGMTAGLFFSNDFAPHFRLGSELHAEIG
jgi:hypothetical protein